MASQVAIPHNAFCIKQGETSTAKKNTHRRDFENDAKVDDDGAGFAAAGTSHEAEARPPVAARQAELIDPAPWASWTKGQRQNWRRKHVVGELHWTQTGAE